ncbi:MAG TPA: winged helix-turn-helix domain-containing protein [Actinomycetota bacterium]|nr:winged helix-turn-helix domain-containing protein [Actinomycetota bacterium]
MQDIKEQLQALLNKPVESAADADRAAEAAEVLAAYLRAIEGARRLLGDETEADPDARPPGDFAGLTLHDAAERVLERAGKPLHARELGRRIKAGGWTHPRAQNAKPDLIEYQLAARLPRHPDRFRRVAPNTFALSKWDAAAPSRPKPTMPLFSSKEGPNADEIGDLWEEVATAHPWR